ncbi:hypothetical protein XENOCAPTIV_015854 [Xenoophorus captivus]|uniref:Uncharacterized protein n=1 Tax=Xenoophorus captivus TaxID=1517983 RepID=A0ABV0RB01_9TELE
MFLFKGKLLQLRTECRECVSKTSGSKNIDLHYGKRRGCILFPFSHIIEDETFKEKELLVKRGAKTVRHCSIRTGLMWRASQMSKQFVVVFPACSVFIVFFCDRVPLMTV